jgi:hypothetical protein
MIIVFFGVDGIALLGVLPNVLAQNPAGSSECWPSGSQFSKVRPSFQEMLNGILASSPRGLKQEAAENPLGY